MPSDGQGSREPPPAEVGSGDALRDARRASDAEEQIADAERTIADAEDRIAAAEFTIAGTQEETSNFEREGDGAGKLRGGVDHYKADRAQARARQAQRSADRSPAETRQTEEILDRFEVADERDQAATSRDRASDARDKAAAARDRRPPAQGLAPAVVARKKAAADRGHSAGDRAHAGNDRRETQMDREALGEALTQAQTDELTGTLQRGLGITALEAELDRAVRAGTVLTLVFVDVDDLKLRNDRDGHAGGDELLRNVAESMAANLRSYDPVVRYGGDEFICALANADLEAARGRFSDISATLRALDAAASISVGFAVHRPGETLSELTARGDADLYDAKRRRKQHR